MNIIQWIKARFLNHKQLHDPKDPANVVVTGIATTVEDIANEKSKVIVTEIITKDLKL